MENVIWEGKASWLSGIKVIDILLCWTVIWLIVPAIRMANMWGKKYKITDQRIIITEGIASRKESEIELFRIKDLSVEQGMIQKAMNIGDITVRSADASYSNLEMKGIESADKVREQLRTAVTVSRKENNVRMSETY